MNELKLDTIVKVQLSNHGKQIWNKYAFSHINPDEEIQKELIAYYLNKVNNDDFLITEFSEVMRVFGIHAYENPFDSSILIDEIQLDDCGFSKKLAI